MIQELEFKLTILDVAREQLAHAREKAMWASQSYLKAIEALQTAMESDPTVIEANDEVLILQSIFDEAEAEASQVAILVVADGHTGGKEIWSQGGWNIRVRKTLTPIVESYQDFIAHVHRLDAHSIIKSVRVVFNRKKATELYETVMGIDGMRVDEKTSCSLVRESDRSEG